MGFFDDTTTDERGITREADTGRPLIIPPGGGDPVVYERASSVPSLVDNLQWLMRWKVQIVALGLAEHPDLLARVAASSYGEADLLAAVDEAQHRVDTSAQWGTDVHFFCEPDADTAGMPDDMAVDVTAYHLALEQAHITVLDSEAFVVNDELGVAGTLDSLYGTPQFGPVVADTKTGKFYPRSAAVQVAIYANSQRYDPKTGERSPLWWEQVNLARGIVARIPRQGGSCTLTPIRIDRGYELARLAMQLHPYTSTTVADWCEADLVKVTRRDTVHALIEQAPDRAALAQLWRTHKACWTKAHTAAAQARLAQMQQAA